MRNVLGDRLRSVLVGGLEQFTASCVTAFLRVIYGAHEGRPKCGQPDGDTD